MKTDVQPSPRSQRILAAIVLTDAVGFSARMSVDEETTLHLIQRDLDLFSHLCREYEGQVLKSTGDGLLMYFVSAVQSVACSLEIQRRLEDLSKTVDDGDYLEHRIGIHLGDVFFNQVDVMGNGVNIAARLQNYADPGGLCISQTIYDVVKARLNLNATYVGPLQLKNIQEPVPAYKVHPFESEDNTVPFGVESEAFSTSDDLTGLVAVADPIMATVQALNQHPERRRMKKLIFAISHDTWENDADVLARFDLKSLLETLMQRYPTLAPCEAELNRVVASLNRKAQYTAILPTIAEHLSTLYTHADPVDTPEIDDQDSGTENLLERLYQQVATQMETATNAARLKKMMYCICYGTWESNPAVLAQLDSQDLVQRLHHLAPTLKDLKYRLSQVIKRLNRQGVYTRVANTILYYTRVLYEHEHESTRLTSAMPKTGELMASMTRIESATLPATAEVTQVYGSAPHLSWGKQDLVAADVATTAQSAKDRSNLFDLRLDIMRYTNPLRAKVLLYSCLHGPFGFGVQDWSLLRSQTMDDLIRQVFDYCQTFDDLESKLDIIAHCLGENDENAQVAGALAQSMKPYYSVASSTIN